MIRSNFNWFVKKKLLRDPQVSRDIKELYINESASSLKWKLLSKVTLGLITLRYARILLASSTISYPRLHPRRINLSRF